MSGMNTLGSSFEASSLVKKNTEELDTHVDMTAMIDLVFMLNIFFLVTSLVTAMAELDLPAAAHASAADMESSLVIKIIAHNKGDQPQVYITVDRKAAGGKSESVDELVPDSQLEERIGAAVVEARKAGKTSVIVKAEKQAPLSMDARVGSAIAAASDEMKLNFAVMEKD